MGLINKKDNSGKWLDEVVPCWEAVFAFHFGVTWEAPEVFMESGLMWLTLLEEPSGCALEGSLEADTGRNWLNK